VPLANTATLSTVIFYILYVEGFCWSPTQAANTRYEKIAQVTRWKGSSRCRGGSANETGRSRKTKS
jgi:hypothetical protein